jgi:ABC-type glycerol-3-phosphate transport system permease component
MNARTRRNALRTLVAALIAIPFVLPFLFLLSMALRPQSEYLANPTGWPSSVTWANLSDAWNDADLGPALWSSLVSTAIGVAVTTCTSTAAAFWLFIHRGRFANAARWFILAGYIFPAVIWLIPLFVILSRRGYTDSLVVLGVIYGVSNVPFGVYLVHSFYRQTLSPDVLDAAALDGATILQQFRLIAVPLARPALAALAALVFVWAFGDLLFAVTLIQDPGRWTVTIAASTLSTRDGISVSTQAAAAVISLIPSLLVLVAAQRALTRGFGGGGSKG